MHDPTCHLATLYRPTGEAELRLVIESGFSAWPDRLPEQPFFYEFNRHIVGRIRVIRAFVGSPPREVDIETALAAV